MLVILNVKYMIQTNENNIGLGFRVVKPLVIKLIILLVLIICANIIVLALIPITWAEPVVDLKLKEYAQNAGQYDAVFLGSSLTYRQIDPSEFTIDGESISSLNMGAPAFYFPKTLPLFREVLAMAPSNLEHIIIEMDIQNTPNTRVWHTLEHKYWYDYDTTKLLIGSLQDTRTERTVQRRFTQLHILSLVEKQLNWGIGLDITKYLFFRQSNSNTMGPALDGYYSLDQAASISAGSAQIFVRRRNLRADTSLLTERLRMAMQVYRTREIDGRYSEAFHETLLKMIVDAEQEGVHLVFVLPPRLQGRVYRELIPVFDQLPEINRIDMADPNKFPEFYELNNSWDVAHLNERGSQIYTRILSEQLSTLIDSD